ncbi:sensor histidine kinase [Leptolyngbya sp. NIES-2104]|uniref:sensor histidine kinase n=1 Tax=Leptolyngbya sp. NIES-2104 TaxID=1552121 RepID=UPI00073F1962|nr:CHASE3 domain-containing protein [Leptolyngbya sp. NIES-2104]
MARYMKRSFSRKASIGVWCSLAALIGIGMLSYSTLTGYREAKHWESHTQQVLLTTESLLSQLKDAEVGQRGYLLTNDRQYLQPYDDAIQVVDQTMDRLQELVRDNSSQKQRLSQIDQLMTDRLSLLRQTIQLADQNRMDEARSIVKSNRGRFLMIEIRGLINQMQSQERQLLDQRSNAEQRRLNLIVWLTLPSCLAIALFLELLVWQLRRNLIQRETAEQALQKQNDKLNLLYDTTRDLLLAEDPIALLDNLYERLSVQLELDLYFNYLVTPRQEDSYLKLASSYGLTTDQKAEFAHLEIGQAVCGTAVKNGAQICLADVQNSTLEQAILVRSIGITAYSCQPLITKGKVLGSLSFGSRSRTFFTQEEQELMQAAADQVAIALDRANLMKSLQNRSEQLAKSNQIKDEFLAVLSHELRTPLNPILGWVQLLRQRKFDQAGLEKALEIIERNAKIQINLIDDLLDVSRILKGKLVLKKELIDLRDVIQSAIDTVQLSANTKGITLESTIPDASCMVLGDSNRLQQIIWNLLSNAIKFSPENERVEISLVQTGPIAQITVRDQGIGINPEFLPYVFDHFKQADGSSTRQFGGLGLGLAIVQHLAELHGGTVHAESEGEGRGATFTVELPILEFASLEQLCWLQKQPTHEEK